MSQPMAQGWRNGPAAFERSTLPRSATAANEHSFCKQPSRSTNRRRTSSPPSTTFVLGSGDHREATRINSVTSSRTATRTSIAARSGSLGRLGPENASWHVETLA